MPTDFEKVDAYVNGPADYEEIPELTDEFFSRGTLMIGGKPVPRRHDWPAVDGAPDDPTTLRLDPAVIEGFRATGAGWQTRINDVLREWLAKQVA